jgi:ubiquinone biosynthesis monooxygenase Coq7
MACTAAVEEVIDDHYAAQAAQLGEEEAPLRQVIEEFQADEREHKQTALANGAEQAVGYPVLSALIKSGCRAAIWMAERI